MSNAGLRTVLRHLRRVAGGAAAGCTDAALLERFVATRDEVAFELLVWRHGPMVLGLCRRLLGHEQDAEDAFQATFLALARKAGSIRKREAVGSFLYKVAYRTALRARAAVSRRPVGVPPGVAPPAPEPEPDLVWRDLRPVLDEELSRLPEKYRAPVVLCDLEVKTHEEAARQLGCPRATVATRLGRARALLRLRLTRRGLALPVGAAALALAPGAASAVVPAPLLDVTLRAVSLSGAAAAGTQALGSRAAALADGVLREMFLGKVKAVAVAVLLAAGVLGLGTGALLYQVPATEPAQPARQDSDDGVSIQVPSQRDGVLLFVGTDIRKGEKVPADQVVTVKVGGKVKSYRRLRVGDAVEEGQLLARVEDRLARDQVAIRQAAVEAAEADHRAALKTRNEAKRRYEVMTKARLSPQMVSYDDYRGAKLTWDRYVEEEKAKAAAVRQARAELQAARTVLDLYEIRSSVRGVIRAIYRHRGEAVRNLEPVFLVRMEERRSGPASPHTPQHRVRVPSETEGKLLFVATDLKPEEARLIAELKREGKPLPDSYLTAEMAFLAVEAAPGEQVPPEQQVHFPGNRQTYRPWRPGDKLVPGKTLVARQVKELRRLEVGMRVEEGQLLALVNPALALDDLAVKNARLEAAEADRRAAVKTKEEAEKRYDAMTRSRRQKPDSVSDDDYRGIKLTWDRYIEEEVAREVAVRQRQRELQAAVTVLNLHEIRATRQGVIRRFIKHRGEGVRYLEPLLELEVSEEP
jgi:RNA polymerase sigma factor (sigma-70 family)